MNSFGRFVEFCQLYRNLPRIPDPSIVDPLVPLLRDGSLLDRDRNILVDQHTRLILSRAFTYKTRFDFEDLVQNALLELTQLIKFDASTRLVDNNLTAFLCSEIGYGMIHYVTATHTAIKMSRTTFRRKKASLPGFSSNHLTEEECYVQSDANVVDVIDFCEHLAQSEREKQTLQLLIEGHTQREISETIGFSQQTITRTIQELRHRYLACA